MEKSIRNELEIVQTPSTPSEQLIIEEKMDNNSNNSET